MVLALPKRSNSRSCKARSSFGCKFEADVPDFVEKQRALVGDLESAFFLHQGAGNAPFSCPNSSLSTSPAGMAAQFSRTNVRFCLS